MNFLLLTAVTALSAGSSQVQLRDGRSIEGQVVEASADLVIVDAAGEELRFSGEGVRSIKLGDSQQKLSQRGLLRLQLRDDSVLFSKSILVVGTDAKVSVDGVELSFPIAQIHYVRFGIEAEKDQRWEEILARRPTADSIVVQGPDDLEALEGVLGGVSKTHVTFEFDGDSIDVNRKKVEGFIYYAAKKIDYPQSPCIVRTASGSLFQAESIKLDRANGISIRTKNGISLQLPLHAIRQIEYSDTDTVFLSDLEPEAYSWSPAFSVGQPLPELQALYKPTQDVNFFGDPLVIRPTQLAQAGRSFKKGISLQSKTKVTYRLAGEYRRLQALAGIDDRFVPQGNVVLKIMGDGNVLFSNRISGTSDATGIDVNLSTVKRLTIEVNFGDNSSTGDHLNLCNARLSK